MKKFFVLTIITCFLYACSGDAGGNNRNASKASEASEAVSEDKPAYDLHRGEGKFDHVDVNPTLNTTMADAGKKVYDTKCSSCHKLTNEKLVGPGWEGVTKKLSPEWIMNFITNPDAMIDKDPHAQAQLEICLVRMPNQNLTDDDARNVYEFMRKNDGLK